MLSRDLAYGLVDPAIGSLWLVTVPFNDGNTYMIYVERIMVTFPKIPFRPRPTDGSNSYFPERKDIDGINMTLYETFDFRVSKWLDEWRKLMFDDDGNYGAPDVFKQSITLQLFARDNLESPIKTRKYYGVAPTDVTAFELNFEDETNRIVIEAQFSVDEGLWEDEG